MVTGVTNLNQLLLRWDGSAVQWGSASLGDDGQQVWSYGSREIRNPNMLPEVVLFLQGRFKGVEKVLFTSRYSQATMMPSVVVEGDLEAAEKWYKLHHSPSEEVSLRMQHLDSIDTHPVIVEVGDEVWEQAVTNAFPQASRVSQQGSLLKSAAAKSRITSKWVVFVDAGEKGADIVASKGGVPTYIGSTQVGLTDSMLYNIVNAMHRDGLKPEDVSVNILGEGSEDLSISMKRFFEEVEKIGGGDVEYAGLKAISE